MRDGTVVIPGRADRVLADLAGSIDIVGVGASKFIFPLDTVVEVIENRVAHAALDARGRGVVELRDRALPAADILVRVVFWTMAIALGLAGAALFHEE